MTQRSETQPVVDAIRERERFVVVTHESPDGDALGSLLAAHLLLERLGKDSVMFLTGQSPLPGEYRFLMLDEVRREVPADVGERTLLAVDCAQENRLGPESAALLEAVPFVVNIDHHHDNSRFGDVDLVVPEASSTGEVLADVMVKHATPPPGLTLEQAAADLWERAGADGIIVSGAGTGRALDPTDLATVRAAVPGAPLYAGSGVTEDTVADILGVCVGAIVGTATKVDGITTNRVDPERAKAIVKAAK